MPEASGQKQGEGGESGAAPARAQTPGEQRAGLDRELEESLSEFDGMLLREQETLEERRQDIAAAEAAAAAGSGGGSGSGAFGGGASGAASSGGGDAGGEPPGEGGAASGASPDAPGGEEQGGSSAGSSQSGEAAPRDRIPPDISDGADDDIIARQLREAAMAEDDPELRARLWQEYRDYKSGQRGGKK